MPTQRAKDRRPRKGPAVSSLPTRFSRTEYACLYCGHDCMPSDVARDAHGEPRCPRCSARLLLRRHVRAFVPAV